MGNWHIWYFSCNLCGILFQGIDHLKNHIMNSHRRVTLQLLYSHRCEEERMNEGERGIGHLSSVGINILRLFWWRWPTCRPYSGGSTVMARLKCLSFSICIEERVRQGETGTQYEHLSLVWVDSAGYFGRTPSTHLDTPSHPIWNPKQG